jgi:O-succinylbenzoic acid--CoA ligase
VSIPRWAERAAESPAAPALVTATRTWTCAEMATAVAQRLATWRGASRVGLVGAASSENLVDLLAAIDGDVPALMIHPRWTPREVDAIVTRAQPSIVIDGGRIAPEASPAGRPRAIDGTLAIVATSGTTGSPKLAVLSRRAFVSSAWASAAHLGSRPEDRWLLAMPLAHVGGLGVVVRSLVYRAPIVLHEGPGDWLPLARAAKATHVSLVPTTLSRLLDSGQSLPTSVRAVLVGGAACPDGLLERALDAGVPVHPTYGLTETCGQVATALTDPRALVPLPGVEIRVTNGMIHVRSPTAMEGWLDAESPFDDDGFYDTGDLGELSNGHLTIHARRSDLVVSGGENVYPREVENALERIEGVRSACVFGVPDVVWGQRVAVAIVVDASAPSDEVILTHARRELAGFKVPRLVARLDALELNGTGKIDRARTAARSMPLLRTI